MDHVLSCTYGIHPPPLFLLLLLPLLGMPSCGDSREGVGAAADLAERKDLLGTARVQLETEMKHFRAESEKRLGRAILQYDTLSRSNVSLRGQLEEAEDEAARTRAELDACKARYKAGLRAKARGLALGRLATTDGRIFNGVVVSELTPTEAGIAHSGGAARVPLAKLSPDVQQKLLYDGEEVEAMTAARIAGADAISGFEEVVGVRMRDPAKFVDAVVVRTLTQRIVSRQAMIVRAENEAASVQTSPDAATNIAKYRLAHLEDRVVRLKNDIETLRTRLDLELNGPQSAGGPTNR